jgi:drug/metabolite transporter (DMT)-like permease
MKTNLNSEVHALYFYGFILAFLAGVFWSFGPITVRYMVAGQDYTFQYLFFRGLSISAILILYLIITEGYNFYKNFLKIGLSGILGGFFLATAFVGFIFSITMTTAAVTLFMLAAMPFIAAIFGYFILGEILRRSSFLYMLIAFGGVCIMILSDSISGSALGALMGLLSASGFALYTITIRWKPKTPKFTTVVMAGIFCAIFSFIALGLNFEKFYTMPTINTYLSILHGVIVGIGLILFTLGAKYLPAAELALISLMEVVGGVFWVWFPLFGINEVPSLLVIIGGFIITLAVLLQGLGSKRKRMPVLP